MLDPREPPVMPSQGSRRPASEKASASRGNAAKPAARGDRARLSRNLIIRAALQLIDRNGSEALNMRDLGTTLGASTMSVYRYFQNKADLLDAVVDQVIDGLVPKSPESSWQAEARTLTLRVRSAMLAHPNLADFMARELRRSAISLRVNAEIVERLRATGVPVAFLSETYWALASYANGFALLEVQARKHGRGRNSEKRKKLRIEKLTEMLKAVEEIPESDVPGAATVLSRPLDEGQFLFGLDCLIKGLESKFRLLDGD